MLGVALLKGSFRQSDVVLSYGIFSCCDFSVVDDTESKIVVFQGAASSLINIATFVIRQRRRKTLQKLVRTFCCM